MVISFLVPIIFSFNLILIFCNAQDTNYESKSVLVEGILKKLFNLTITSFGNLPYEERKNMMIKIEKKLNKSAQSLGPKSGKYVALLMEGVRSISSQNNKHNYGDFTTPSNDNVMSDIKNKKISTGVKKTIAKHVREEGEHTKHVTKKQSENWIDRNTSIKSMLKNNAKLNNLEKNDSRRMEFEFNDNINVNTASQGSDEIKYETQNSDELFKVKNSRIEPDLIHLEPKDVTLKSPCHDHDDKTLCNKIKALGSIECMSNEIPIENLCNGIDDCSDYSDERNCAEQGIIKVRNASQIMSDVEYALAHNCYTAKAKNFIVTKQNEVLHHILQRQLKIIQEHAHVTNHAYTSTMRKFNVQPKMLKKTVNQVANVITSLSSTLNTAFCQTDDGRKFINDDYFLLNYDHESKKTTTWSPNSCSCFDEYCIGECTKDCKKICVEKFSIGRWQCNAVSSNKTIPLDLLCDGKLDCFDETDENGCNSVSDFTKFESGAMYNLILNMISTKVKSAIFEKVRYKLINLQKLISKLQKSASQQKPDVLEVKTLRDRCFLEMMDIYEQTQYYGPNMKVMDDTYVFLMSVNQNLVSAMKLSHTGNDMIVAPNGCYCRNKQCVLPKCSNTCMRACPAEPKLTKYFCGGSLASNVSIPLEAICNGKNDCFEKDDEQGCSKDICRNYHFVLLRHNLEKANAANGDTFVGGAFNSWITKVSASLKVLESNERPTPQFFRDVINNMLHDLVMTYAGLTSPKRRSNDVDVIDEFYKMALVVMNAVKSCAK